MRGDQKKYNFIDPISAIGLGTAAVSAGTGLYNAIKGSSGSSTVKNTPSTNSVDTSRALSPKPPKF